ncbi:MAG: FG-GAP-like repeat-containing protein [Chthoniobacteraceae bacterium]
MKPIPSSVEILEPRIAPATISIVGTSGNDVLKVIATSADSGTYQLNNDAAVAFTGVTHFAFSGGDGDDTLIIVNPTGSVFAPVDGIVYAGENNATAAGDSLILKGGGGAAFGQQWVLDTTPDSGTLITSDGTTTQTIHYSGLEPITDTAAATSLTVTGTNANNAINYGAGTVAGDGLVSVDNNETIEFANKTTLIINALAGSDTINLNTPTTTPTGLTSITVNGGDPTTGDTLIVNGRVNVADAFTYTPATSTSDTGSVAITGLPTVNFTTMEHLVINGQNGGPGGTGDSLTINTSNLSSSQTEILTPGTTFDSGHVDFRDRPGGVNPAATSVDFLALGVAGSLSFTDSGRFDQLIYNGTALNDTFSVNASGQVTLNTQIAVNTSSLTVLTLAGLDGNDTFNIAGNHNLPSIIIQGGNSSGSDVVNFNGTGVAVTVNPTAGTVAETGFGTVTLSGIETLNVNASTGDISVLGTAGADTFSVTPTGTNTASVALAGVNLAINTNNSGALIIDSQAGSGLDVLQIYGSDLADTITAAASSVTLTGGATGTVTIGTGIGRLDIYALGGNDHVDLSALATLPTRIFGGDGNDYIIGSAQDDLIDGGSGSDVIHGGGGHNTLLNNGPFGFTSPTAYDVGKLPKGAISADFNGDGISDLAIVNSAAGTVSIMLGTATGRFLDPVSFSTGGKLPNSIAVGDFNGDNHLDLAIANGGSGTVAILLGDGTGSFGAASTFSTGKKPLAIHTADFNNDNVLDLALISGKNIVLLTGVGDGTFTSPQKFATGGNGTVDFAVGDFNNDTFNDIVTVNKGSGTVSFLAGTGTGFNAASTFKTGQSPVAITTGDFNGDGALDLAVANAASKFVSILLGNGSLSGPQFNLQTKIAAAISPSSGALVAANLNGDGITDLALTNATTGQVSVFTGLGTGLFAAPLNFSLGGDTKIIPGSLVLGDFNGDGATDLAVTVTGANEVSVLEQIPG